MWRPLLLVSLVLVLGCKDEPPTSTAASAAPARATPSAGATMDPVETVDDRPLADGDEVETVDDQPDPSSDDEVEVGEDEDDGCAPKDPTLKPLQLLQFRFTSGIEGKDAKDKLHVARPGTRVYAHFRMRNRSGRKRCMKLTFRVGNKKRTEVTLKVGKSWNWRTYAYNTLKPEDREPLRLTVEDDQGVVILDERLAVIPEAKR